MYKIYDVVISQSGTSIPTVETIYENTLGVVEFGYDNPGEFSISGDFPVEKTTLSALGNGNLEIDDNRFFKWWVAGENSIRLWASQLPDFSVMTNGITRLHLQIRVKY